MASNGRSSWQNKSDCSVSSTLVRLVLSAVPSLATEVGKSNLWFFLPHFVKDEIYNFCLTLEWYRVQYFKCFEIIFCKVLNKCKAVLDVLLVIPQSIVACAFLAGRDIPDPLRTISPEGLL